MRALGTCLFWIALYAALTWGFRTVFARRLLDAEPAFFAGAFAAFIAIIGIGWVLQIGTKLRAVTRVRRGLAGEEPVDGEPYAACGPIESAAAEPLLTPFTRTPAVAYTARLTTPRDRRAWESVALGPARIQCGSWPVRLLALPRLDVDEELCTGDEAARNAEAWVRSTAFSGERARFLGKSRLPRAVYENGNDAIVYSAGEGLPQDGRARMLHERVIKPGDVVCAIGIYSMARGGLVVDPAAKEHSIILRKGRPEAAVGAIVGSIGNLVKAGITFAILALAIGLLHTFVPLNAVEIARPDLRVSWLEVAIDDLLESRVRPEIHSAGIFPLETPDYALDLALGEARGRVKGGELEADVVRAETRAAGDTVDVLLFDSRGRLAAALKVSRQGLIRARILGDEIDFRNVPLAIYDFKADDDEVAGRVSWVAEHAPSARVRFRATLEGR
jgi:hypothetical protein